MSIGVLTALTDSGREARLVADLERDGMGVVVVRRCVDLADLVAAAATGTAAAAVISADLRRLDRDALARLAAAGVAVVCLAGTPAPEGQQSGDVLGRLSRLGLVHVLGLDASAAQVAAAVRDAVTGGLQGRTTAVGNGLGPPGPAAAPTHGYADPRSAGTRPDGRTGAPPVGGEPPARSTGPLERPGRLIAVWGPTGAPGRSTVAIALASEASALGVASLLVDADVYGGVVAQALGVLDESPGLAAAARAATSGTLDLAGLARLAPFVAPGLRVVSGIARAERWPELRASAIDAVLVLARELATLTVVDCGFSLEQDEEIVYDTAAPRRNGATLTALAAADTVIAVGTADPIGLQRLVRGLADLRDAVPGQLPVVVVNRVRAAAVGRDAQHQIAAALRRYAGVHDPVFIPLDVAGCDAAIATGRTLAEAAPASPTRLALRALAARLAEVGEPAHRRRVGRPGGARRRPAVPHPAP